MRPIEYTSEDIIRAGQVLRDAGRNITGFALRQQVGGGNPSRLKQVWDEHLASQSVTKVEPVAELPIEVAEEVAAVTRALTDRLASLAVELNDKAVKAAERRVAEVLRTAGEQREQAERELVDAAQTVEDLEASLEEAKGRIVSLSSQLGQVQSTSQAQAVEIAQLRERLAAAEQGAEQLRTDLAAQMKAADAAATERDQARLEAARLAGQLAALQEQNSAILARLAPPAAP